LEWFNKKVLITGAGGFIGSHLVEHLVRKGAIVRAFVRYNSRNNWGLLDLLPKDILDNLEIFLGDIQDPQIVKKAVKGSEIVFHLASLIAIPYSYIAPMSFVNTNVLGTLHIMEACLQEGVERVIHTSTSEVYGTAKYVPIDEDHPLQGQSPYSASKIGADKVAESYYYSFNLPVAIIRPFNTYGPRQSARAIIPTIITQLLTNNKLKLGNLSAKRDLNYIDDTVEGFLKVATVSKAIGETINIGSNTEISIEELAYKIMYIMNKKVPITIEETRKRPSDSEVWRLKADNRKAKKLLDWEPKFSLDNGLKHTIKWIKNHIDIYKSHIYNL